MRSNRTLRHARIQTRRISRLFNFYIYTVVNFKKELQLLPVIQQHGQGVNRIFTLPIYFFPLFFFPAISGFLDILNKLGVTSKISSAARYSTQASRDMSTGATIPVVIVFVADRMLLSCLVLQILTSRSPGR